MPNGSDYIDNVYNALKDNLQGFDKTPDDFRNKVLSDTDYRNNVYKALKDNLDGFTKTPDDFNTAVGGQKKNSSTTDQSIPSTGSTVPSANGASGPSSTQQSNSGLDNDGWNIHPVPTEKVAPVLIGRHLSGTDALGNTSWKTPDATPVKTTPTSKSSIVPKGNDIDKNNVDYSGVIIPDKTARVQGAKIEAANAMQNTDDAKHYLLTQLHTNNAKLVLKDPTAPISQVSNFDPTDLNNYTLESIKNNIDPNDQKSQLAFSKYQHDVNLNDAISSSTNLNDAALTFESSQNPLLKKQVDKMNAGGQRIPDAYNGQIVADFLSDPSVIQKTKTDPDFRKQYNQTAFNLYNTYPSYAKRVIGQKISQEREDIGQNNGIANIPTPEETDELVDKMVQTGKLSEQEKGIYERSIRPSLGIGNSIARGAGHILAPEFTENSPIETPDIASKFGESYQNTIKGMAHSVEDLPLVPGLTNEQRLSAKLQDDYSNIALNPVGAWHTITTETGNLGGMIAPMILGGEALKAMGTPEKAASLLNNTLIFESQNKDKALEKFPDSPAKQLGYTVLGTAADAALAEALPTKEVGDAVNGAFKDDIGKVVNEFTDGNITAAAAKKTVLEKTAQILGKDIPKIVSSTAEKSIHTGATMAGFSLIHNGIDAVFGARDTKNDDVINDAVQAFKSGFLGSLGLSGLSTMSEAKAKINGANIQQMANNPEQAAEMINKSALVSPELAASKDERLANLQEATKVNSELNQTTLTDAQKQKFLLNHLAQKVLETRAEGVSTDVIKDNILAKAKEHQNIKEAIYTGQDKAPEFGSTRANASTPKSDIATPDYLVSRHADTIKDEQDLVSGPNQSPLSPDGKKDAHDLATEVQQHSEETKTPVTKVISSDLERAKETAKTVADKTGAKVVADPGLRTWDIGEFDDTKDDMFKQAQKWFVEHPDEKVYGGDIEDMKGKKLGETFNEYKDRTIAAHEPYANEPAATLLIDHSNNMMIMDALRKNNGVWDDRAAHDYLNSEKPEPATLVKKQALEKPVIENKGKGESLLPPKELTRQEKVNNLIDDVTKHNEMRRNSPDRVVSENDIKLRAEELGIKVKKNGSVLSIENDKGNTPKKVNSIKNSAIDPEFNVADYSKKTTDFIDNTLDKDNWHNLPPIKGIDGRTMSMGQLEDAVNSIKEGKITHGAKAIYDAVEKIFNEDNADYSDKRLNFEQQEKMPADDFVKQFEKSTEPATDDDIQSLHDLMGPEAFEQYFNELKNQEDEYNKNVHGDDKESTSSEEGNNNPEHNAESEPRENTEVHANEGDSVQEPVVEEPDNNNNGGQSKTSEPDLPSGTVEENKPDVESAIKKNNQIKYARSNSYRFFREKYPDIDIHEYNRLRAQKLTIQEAKIIPFVKEFWDHDVMPRVDKFAGGSKEFLKGVVNTLSPKTGVSEKAVTHIAGALGDRNEAISAIDKALGGMEKMFNKMSDGERIAFIDRMKKGEKQPTAELQKIADAVKQMDKDLYDGIKEYKPTLAWKEDHFRVLWKKIPGAEKERLWSTLIRRPFRGSMGFVKAATLADMTEGIERGGEPYSTNPITMFKMAYADGMKFITAQRMFEALKKDKMVQFVKTGKEVPDGFVPLNDRMAKIYFKTPEGLVNTGEYYIQEGAGRLLNNHLSRDYIRETKVGKGLMNLKNIYSQVELGFSLYHAMAEGLESVSSTIGLGLRKMINMGIRGDFKTAGEGILDILKSPFSPATTFTLGRNTIKLGTESDFENSSMGKAFLAKVPDAKQYIHDLFQGGGILKQNDEWRAKTFDVLKENAGKDNYIGAAIRALPALNETLMSPLFNHYIPALKVGMFMKEFPLALQEQEGRIAAGKTTREEVARKTVGFIDDRLGEMNFDNLYWNRTFKTGMQFMTRSVTWKLGNIRAMGGSLPEQAMEFINAAKEKRAPLLMPKMAWLLGLTTMQVALASVIQHVAANKPLSTMKDLVAPQIDPNDPKQRVVLPTYYKDMLHLSHSPGQYITSSASGVLGKMMDVWNNKDFYGYEIHDPNDSKLKQTEDNSLYMMPKPFSISSAMQMHDQGASVAKQAMSFIGLQAAPGYLTNTDIENEIFDLNQVRNAGIKPKAEKEGNDAKKEIRNLYKSGDREGAQEKTDEAVQKGIIRPAQARYLFTHSRSDQTAAQQIFDRLPFSDRQYLYNKMTPSEQHQYDPRGKLKRQIKNP